MRNLIKADVHRINHSKPLYVVGIVCICFVLMSVLVFRGLDMAASALLENPDAVSGAFGTAEEAEETMNLLATGMSFQDSYSVSKECLKSDTLIYCLIAIFVLVSGIEFGSGTIKNTLIAGINRKSVYFSKFITSSIYTIAYLLVYSVSAILFSMLVYWEGMNAQQIFELLWITLKQIPVYIGIIAAGHCFVFATQSTVASVVLFIVSFLFFNTILPMFNMLLQWDVNITLMFPLYQCIELVNSDTSTLNYIVIYGSTLLYILAYIGFGYWKFRKTEIK